MALPLAIVGGAAALAIRILTSRKHEDPEPSYEENSYEGSGFYSEPSPTETSGSRQTTLSEFGFDD